MNTTQVFNTEFEVSMRVLLVLSVYKNALGVDLITVIDLFNTYGKNYKLTETNLHGDNSLSFDEITSRRELVKSSLKNLVLERLITPVYSKSGFQYLINDKGIALCNKMSSDYSTAYLAECKKINGKLSNYSEKQIIEYSNEIAIKGDI